MSLIEVSLAPVAVTGRFARCTDVRYGKGQYKAAVGLPLSVTDLEVVPLIGLQVREGMT